MSKSPDQSIEIQSAASVPLHVTGTFTVPSFTVSGYLGAPVVADPDRIVTSADWANGALTVAAQPDTPRNLTVTVTDANASITGGTLTLIGTDATGGYVSEVMDITDGLTWVGNKIFASVTSATIAGTAGTAAPGTDVVIVGVGNKIGLPQDIVSTSAIKHVYLGGTRIASPVLSAGAQTSSVDASAATYNGTKALHVLYSPVQ